MQPKITASIETITPEFAYGVLMEMQKLIDSGQLRQRHLKPSKVSRYANDMRQGKWRLNHQGIAFNEQNWLIDGQHRLWGVYESKTPVDMFVVRGFPTENPDGHTLTVMDTIDVGIVRSLGAQLKVTHGLPNGNEASAICNTIAKLLVDRSINVSMADALFILSLYEKDMEAVYSHGKAIIKLTSAIKAPLVLYHNHAPRKAREFMQGLVTMENLPANHPVLALIRWKASKPMTGGTSRFEQAVATCSCLRYFDNGEKMLEKVYASKESYQWMMKLQKQNVAKLRTALGYEPAA